MKRRRSRSAKDVQHFPIHWSDGGVEEAAFPRGATLADLAAFLATRGAPLAAVLTTFHPCTARLLMAELPRPGHSLRLVRHQGRLSRQGEQYVASDNGAALPPLLLEQIARPGDRALLLERRMHPSELLRGGMLLVLKTLTGQTLSLCAEPFDMVGRVKELVQLKTGIIPDEQRLMFGGRQLAEDRTLADYSIKANDTLHLVLRLRGGMLHVSSGREDYCSTVPLRVADGAEARVPAVALAVTEGAQTLHFHCHPNVPTAHVERMIAMELDEAYFAQRTHDELVTCAAPALSSQLSRAALERLVSALAE